MTIQKKVKLTLEGLDGNAMALIGAFRRAARKQGWDPKEISDVTHRATAGDYDHLLSVLMEVCEDEN